jgi:hypothetical protein
MIPSSSIFHSAAKIFCDGRAVKLGGRHEPTSGREIKKK